MFLSENVSDDRHIIAVNEGNAFSLALGYFLATKKIPMVYMQNSGLGNAINPLLSLADKQVYSIPLIMMIGWRGEPGVKDEPQHCKQGAITIDLLKTMDVPYQVIGSDTSDDEIFSKFDGLIQDAIRHSRPCALVVKKNSFLPYKLKNNRVDGGLLSREDAIKIIVDNLSLEDVIVSTTGVASRELFEYRESFGNGHHRDFLTVGGMGHASQIALGIALAKRDRNVYCLDGDGAFLMHMGGAAILASMGLNNVKHVLLNNYSHDSVGGQPTISSKIDIQGLATSMGYQCVAQAKTVDQIMNELMIIKKCSGPALLEIQIKKGFRSDLGRPTLTPQENKYEFMRFIND